MKRLSWSTIIVLCGIGVILSSNSLFSSAYSSDTDHEFDLPQIADIATLRANLEQVPYAFSEVEKIIIRELLPKLTTTAGAPDLGNVPPGGQRNILTQAATDKVRNGLKGRREFNFSDKDIDWLLLAINYGIMRDQTSRPVGGEPEERTRHFYNSFTGMSVMEVLKLLLPPRELRNF